MKIMELNRTYLGIEGFGSPTDYQRVPPMVLKYVLLDPHSFVCQYILKLSPSTQPVSDLAAHNRRQLDCVWEDFPDAVRNYASIIQKQVDSAIARENSAQKISSPSLCAHISFFYKDSRIQYLEKEIQGLQTIPNIDIFIHSNLQFSHPLIANNVHLIVHDIKNLHPFFLTWQSRPYFQKQLGQYDYYLYLEDDILFTRKNFEFYLKYHPICKKNNVHLGFLRVECSPTTGDWYILDIFRSLKRRIQLNGIEFAVNDVNPYYAMWILDKEEMHRFIHEYPDCYEFRTLFWGEELNMVRENAATNPNCIMCQMTVVRDEEGADLWHLTNNYVDRDKLFSTLKRNSLLS